MFSHIKKTYGAVDVCVNNAGLAIVAPLLSGETSAWKNVFDVGIDLDMIARVCVYVKYTKLQTCMQVRDLRFSLCRFQVNVMALCICTREAVKLMKEKGIDDGHVVHVSR